MPSYSHLYTIAYEVESHTIDGSDVTATMHAQALARRIAEVLEMGPAGFDECVGAPDDTYQVE